MKRVNRNWLVLDLAYLIVASVIFSFFVLERDYVPATGLFIVAILAVVATAQRIGKIMDEPKPKEPDNGFNGRPL